jgi:hypothetical protein
LSNVEKGRLPRPAKNAGLAMTESLILPETNAVRNVEELVMT